MVVEREREIERERYGEGSGREVWAEPRPRTGLSAGGRSSASPPSHSDAAGGGRYCWCVSLCPLWGSSAVVIKHLIKSYKYTYVKVMDNRNPSVCLSICFFKGYRGVCVMRRKMMLRETRCETMLFQLIRSLLFLGAGLMIAPCYSCWLRSQVGDQLPHIDMGQASRITAAGRTAEGSDGVYNHEFISRLWDMYINMLPDNFHRWYSVGVSWIHRSVISYGWMSCMKQ